MKHAIVEVSVIGIEGEGVVVGLVNAQQALALPEEIKFEVSHPGIEAGGTDFLMDRVEMQDHVDPPT